MTLPSHTYNDKTRTEPEPKQELPADEAVSWKKKLSKEYLKKILREWFLESTQSNLTLSLTVGLGVLIGILPIFGFQTITALGTAWLLRWNKLITLAGSGISTPPFTPLVIYPGYLIGGWFLDSPHVVSFSEITFDIVKAHFIQYAIGSCIFAVMGAVISTLVVYSVLSVVRNKRKSP